MKRKVHPLAKFFAFNFFGLILFVVLLVVAIAWSEGGLTRFNVLFAYCLVSGIAIVHSCWTIASRLMSQGDWDQIRQDNYSLTKKDN